MEVKIEASIEQVSEILKQTKDPVLREQLLNSLKSEEKRLLIEHAKVILMLDALESGNYDNLSQKLIEEMLEVTKQRPLLLSEGRPLN